MATRRTFLVTGVSKGIGRALSQRLADAGHHVVGVARGKDAGFPGTLVSIDLDDSRASGEAFVDLARRYAFDGVVNNVGLARLHSVGEIDVRDVDDMMRLNVHATIGTVQAVLPTLKARGWGRIVNVASLVTVGIAMRSGYAAAKAAHAVEGLTKSAALEVAGSGVQVNAVAPGPTNTDMIVRFAGGAAAAHGLGKKLPVQRLGNPREIADAIVFAAIGKSRFMTGHSISVDGGITA